MLKIKNNVGGSGGKDIIAFQLGQTSKDGKIFYAEQGMTWEEFVNSKYNNDSFRMSGNYIGYGPYMISSSSLTSTLVVTTDIIESKYRYYIVNAGSGN